MNDLTKQEYIKQGSTWFLRLAVLAIGAVVLALCIFALPAGWSDATKEYPYHPQVANALRGLIAVMYFTAVPFYIALYQVLRLLANIDKNIAFSDLSVKSLKIIKNCAITISAAYAASLPLFYIWADNDDAPGLVIVGMLTVMAPLAIAVFAAVMQRLLREAITMKSENELTV